MGSVEKKNSVSHTRSNSSVVISSLQNSSLSHILIPTKNNYYFLLPKFVLTYLSDFRLYSCLYLELFLSPKLLPTYFLPHLCRLRSPLLCAGQLTDEPLAPQQLIQALGLHCSICHADLHLCVCMSYQLLSSIFFHFDSLSPYTVPGMKQGLR